MFDHRNPNHIHAPSEGVTVTPFEQACDAYAAAVVAAAYPSDTKARLVASQACEQIGISYVQAVALTMEKLEQDFQTARFSVVESLGDIVRSMLNGGAAVREGILSNGREANALGWGEEEDV